MLGCLVILCNAEDRSKRLSYHWASNLQNVFIIKIGMKPSRKLMKNKTTRSGVLVLCTASNFHVVNVHCLFTRIIYHLPSSKHYECTFRMIMEASANFVKQMVPRSGSLAFLSQVYIVIQLTFNNYLSSIKNVAGKQHAHVRAQFVYVQSKKLVKFMMVAKIFFLY